MSPWGPLCDLEDPIGLQRGGDIGERSDPKEQEKRKDERNGEKGSIGCGHLAAEQLGSAQHDQGEGRGNGQVIEKPHFMNCAAPDGLTKEMENGPLGGVSQENRIKSPGDQILQPF